MQIEITWRKEKQNTTEARKYLLHSKSEPSGPPSELPDVKRRGKRKEDVTTHRRPRGPCVAMVTTITAEHQRSQPLNSLPHVLALSTRIANLSFILKNAKIKNDGNARRGIREGARTERGEQTV